MKKLILILSVALTLLSCKTDKEPEPGPEKICRISAINPTYRFQYNGQAQLTKITVSPNSSTPYNIELTYDANGRLAKETSSGEYWENRYNNQDQLVEQVQYTTGGPVVDPTVYQHSYNAAGQRTQTISFRPKEPARRLSLATYQYTNDILSSIEKMTYGYNNSQPDSYRDKKDTYTYVLDSQKNPLPALPLMTFDNYFSRGYDERETPILFRGNVIRFSFKRESQSGGGAVNYTVSYEYNEQGYPTESIRTVDGWIKTQNFYTYDDCQ